MNREIKFRVWDLDNNAMFNWEYCRETELLDDAFDGKRAIAMQYTGLKDKNNKEIYEGDILECSFINSEHQKKSITGVVEWDDKFLSYILNRRNYSFGDNPPANDIAILSWYKTHKLNILGNTYEHSELLNKTNK